MATPPSDDPAPMATELLPLDTAPKPTASEPTLLAVELLPKATEDAPLATAPKPPAVEFAPLAEGAAAPAELSDRKGPAVPLVRFVTLTLVAYSWLPFTASVEVAVRAPGATLCNATGVVEPTPPRVTLVCAVLSY